MRISTGCLLALFFLAPGCCLRNVAEAGSLATKALHREFARSARGFEGRVGVCAVDGSGNACLNGGQRFSMQSVWKLLAGMAVMDAVDNRGWKLDERVTVRKQDLSLFVQPLAKIVTAQGSFKTTVGELVRRAIAGSDSAAADILVERLGGPRAVQAFLDRKAIKGARIDRDEKHLATKILGLAWRAEFVDAALLDRAIEDVPASVRDAAYRRYRSDIRDTATPLGMASALNSLASNTLLSPSSSRFLLDVMKQTVTFPDRLKAGAAAGWAVGHKTGTSDTRDGMTVATNDVGILVAPDGGSVAIAVFLGDSRASSPERSALIAKLAAATISQYH